MAIFDKNLFDIPPIRSFTDCAQKYQYLKELCSKYRGIVQFQHLGTSEENRDICAVILGTGKKRISILSGSHSDEPVGSETIFYLIAFLLENHHSDPAFLKRYSFYFIPHINPDGERKNWNWISRWPDISAYLQYAFRELPGRDIEFGYPAMRPENEAAAKFLRQNAPFDAHISLHGMGFAEGIMLLLERSSLDRTASLQHKFLHLASKFDLPLHDQDRHGEKGFSYIGPGFTTTPESKAMQQFFLQQNNPAMANKFKLNSMEFVQSLGGDPFCLVTELPLFVINLRLPENKSGIPAAYFKFRDEKTGLQQKLQNGDAIEKELAEFDITPLPLEIAIYLQLATIELVLETID
ncbi:MAG: peptidase M14 [Calditrichaeota bacterium]|nr:MAG: peptidase M14 [Calditrichota bacterium]